MKNKIKSALLLSLCAATAVSALPQEALAFSAAPPAAVGLDAPVAKVWYYRPYCRPAYRSYGYYRPVYYARPAYYSYSYPSYYSGYGHPYGGGYYGGYGYNPGGALVAGAALGLVGAGVAAAVARPRWGYGGWGGGWGWGRRGWGGGWGW